MIFIKYVDLILIILICSYLGFYKASKFSLRIKSLKNIKNALGIFKSKIEFTYEPIKDIFEEISKIVYQDEENIFKTFNQNLCNDNISIIWNRTVQDSKEYFNNDDKEILAMLGKMLGKTDKNGQISEINLVSNFLDKQIEESEEEKIKNEKLYRSLGIICGLIIAIVLI